MDRPPVESKNKSAPLSGVKCYSTGIAFQPGY